MLLKYTFMMWYSRSNIIVTRCTRPVIFDTYINVYRDIYIIYLNRVYTDMIELYMTWIYCNICNWYTWTLYIYSLLHTFFLFSAIYLTFCLMCKNIHFIFIYCHKSYTGCPIIFLELFRSIYVVILRDEKSSLHIFTDFVILPALSIYRYIYNIYIRPWYILV